VGSFGEQLRRAREARNISLQEIAASTKISSRALQALESEDFQQLPGGIFNKGFVRAYARYVGLDEEKMLAAYMDAAKSDSTDNQLQAISMQVAAQSAGKTPAWAIGGNTVLGIVAIVVALALGALWWKEHRSETREQAATTAAANSAVPANSAPTPAQPKADVPSFAHPSASAPAQAPAAKEEATQPANAAASAAAQPAQPSVTQQRSQLPQAAAAPATSPGKLAPAGPVEISVAATQKSWISVRSDGKMIDSVLLDPNTPNMASRKYSAKEKLRLVVGNAGGLTVSYNGKTELLGKPGQTMIVTITPAGIEKH